MKQKDWRSDTFKVTVDCQPTASAAMGTKQLPPLRPPSRRNTTPLTHFLSLSLQEMFSFVQIYGGRHNLWFIEQLFWLWPPWSPVQKSTLAPSSRLDLGLLTFSYAQIIFYHFRDIMRPSYFLKADIIWCFPPLATSKIKDCMEHPPSYQHLLQLLPRLRIQHPGKLWQEFILSTVLVGHCPTS